MWLTSIGKFWGITIDCLNSIRRLTSPGSPFSVTSTWVAGEARAEEDRDSSKYLAGQSAQNETLASPDLTPALSFFSSIVVAGDPAAPSAVSSTDKMRRPKRPPLRSTRPPSAPTAAAIQSAHAIPTHARSYLTSPEKVQRPELHRTQDYRPWQEWFPRTHTVHRHCGTPLGFNSTQSTFLGCAAMRRPQAVL